jgi:hypothetical protein
VGSS